MNESQLMAQVEQLRSKMMAAAAHRQNIRHKDVLLLSQTLDRLILRVQHEKLARRKTQ